MDERKIEITLHNKEHPHIGQGQEWPCLFHFKAFWFNILSPPDGLTVLDLLLDTPPRFSYIQLNQKGIGDAMMLL